MYLIALWLHFWTARAHSTLLLLKVISDSLYCCLLYHGPSLYIISSCFLFAFLALETNNIERKQTLNLSLDVHPYMLTIQKAKAEIANPEPAPAEHSLSNVYIEGPHTVLQVTSSLTGMSGLCNKDASQ